MCSKKLKNTVFFINFKNYNVSLIMIVLSFSNFYHFFDPVKTSSVAQNQCREPRFGHRRRDVMRVLHVIRVRYNLYNDIPACTYFAYARA